MTSRVPISSIPPSNVLYQQDYYIWLERTAETLRSGNLTELDRLNLAEEIEDMGKREKRSVESNLEIVLMHLLKYKYQPEQRSKSWRFTLLEHRDRLEKAFRDSPSLKGYFLEIFADCYHRARQKAAVETDLDIGTFPMTSPFTPEETLNSDFLPD